MDWNCQSKPVNILNLYNYIFLPKIMAIGEMNFSCAQEREDPLMTNDNNSRDCVKMV